MPQVARTQRKVKCEVHEYCEAYTTSAGTFTNCIKCGHAVNQSTKWVQFKEFVTQWWSFLVEIFN